MSENEEEGEDPKEPEEDEGTTYRCSECKGEVPEGASKCKHCRTDLDSSAY